MVDVGEWLVEHRADLDRAEAEWLQRLAEFDREWPVGERDVKFLCCATWLIWRTNMARSTAFREATGHARADPPAGHLPQRVRYGRLSYSAVRAITRMDRPAPDVDEALVANWPRPARPPSLEIERVVRSYALYADQEREPGRRPPTRPGRQDQTRRPRLRPGDRNHSERSRDRRVCRRPPGIHRPALSPQACGRVFSRRLGTYLRCPSRRGQPGGQKGRRVHGPDLRRAARGRRRPCRRRRPLPGPPGYPRRGGRSVRLGGRYARAPLRRGGDHLRLQAP